MFLELVGSDRVNGDKLQGVIVSFRDDWMEKRLRKVIHETNREHENGRRGF